MGKIILVLGGTKSGKTGWAQKKAEELAEASGKNVAYLATATALDEGMKERIRRHRESRPAGWVTWEEPLHAAEILPRAAEQKAAVILDCFTLLATNIILGKGDNPDRSEAMDAVTREVEELLLAAGEIEAQLIIISNHVEVGLVAPTPLGGLFQDIAGLSHQMIAAKADEVYLLTAGLPQRLK